MTWLEIMVNRALNDPYLNELTRKLELKYAHNFLYQKDDIVLTEKEFDDVLRFADILSRSSGAEGRNKAYKIISLLYDAYKDDIQFLQAHLCTYHNQYFQSVLQHLYQLTHLLQKLKIQHNHL